MKKILIATLLISLALTQYGCYSCKSWHHMWGSGPVEPEVAEKLWFDKECKTIQPEEPAPAPKPQSPPPAPKPAPKVGKCGATSAQIGLPCSGCSVVVLSKQMPELTTPGAPFNYTITAKNVSNDPVANVVVTERVTSPLTVVGATPKATVSGGNVVWNVDRLDPGQAVTMKVTAKAGQGDCAKTCADVKYDVLACAAIKIVEPALKLTKVAPKAVLQCEPIPVKLTVTNTGTGAAKNVVVTDMVPDGLTANGKNKVVFNAGTLGAGQSKQFTTTLSAKRTGTFENKAVAKADGGLTANAATTTVVTKPVLAITKTGPSRRYLGRTVSYDIVLKNTGDAAATSVVLKDTIPSGVTNVVASNGGVVSGSSITWNVASLKPGASKKVTVTYKPTKVGTVKNTASAVAKCAEGVSASAQTAIAGIPAVLLEVIDIDDPVEIGGTTTYVITATNQGTAVGTNISITCTLEENEQYVSSSGATSGSLSGATVNFVPLKSLAPKAKATWKVVVKAVKPGDVRFKVTMNTDQITRPVEETESTHLYQ